ncbi:hypothetical protein QTP86_026496 [Hemibagrus guttatus]|nr:hypothetical protein QTP86_026496 [Hemibagrus guttatus]
MKILLFFTLCLISDGGASSGVTGYSGGGVLIKCMYGTEYRQNSKYFCKGSWPGCSDQIKTEAKDKWVNSGRFSLYDDTKSAEFWVMIRELTVQDTGTYQCGVDKSLRTDIYTPVELRVKEGPLVSREVTAYAGGGVNIKCRYEDEYKDKTKSFCKIGTNQLCLKQIQTKQISEWSHDGRFSIHDSRSVGFFSVFIRELITEDTGSYGCGVVVSDKMEIYTVVKLNVREGSASTTGRGSLKDPGNSQGVPLDACEYEEIKDTRRLSASDAGTFTVYAIAHLPTNPCDSGVYSTAQLPTIPSDQDIYSKAQLPTRLSAEESAEDLNYATLPWGALPPRHQRRRVWQHPAPAPRGVPVSSETDIVTPEPSFVGGHRSVRVLGGGRRSKLLLGCGRHPALLLGCGRVRRLRSAVDIRGNPLALPSGPLLPPLVSLLLLTPPTCLALILFSPHLPRLGPRFPPLALLLLLAPPQVPRPASRSPHRPLYVPSSSPGPIAGQDFWGRARRADYGGHWIIRVGVVVSDELEIYTVVKLNVREDLSYEKSISETVHVGGDL